MRRSVVLPAPLGPSSAWICTGADREVDAGERVALAEPAFEAAHVDGWSALVRHGAMIGRA